jgi:hypothetical protein
MTKFYSNDPQHVSEDVWYYETKKGIEIYGNIDIGTKIPWKLLDSSMRRRRAYLRKLAARRRASNAKDDRAAASAAPRQSTCWTEGQ